MNLKEKPLSKKFVLSLIAATIILTSLLTTSLVQSLYPGAVTEVYVQSPFSEATYIVGVYTSSGGITTYYAQNQVTGAYDALSTNGSYCINYALTHLTSGRKYQETVFLKDSITITSPISVVNNSRIVITRIVAGASITMFTNNDMALQNVTIEGNGWGYIDGAHDLFSATAINFTSTAWDIYYVTLKYLIFQELEGSGVYLLHGMQCFLDHLQFKIRVHGIALWLQISDSMVSNILPDNGLQVEAYLWYCQANIFENWYIGGQVSTVAQLYIMGCDHNFFTNIRVDNGAVNPPVYIWGSWFNHFSLHISTPGIAGISALNVSDSHWNDFELIIERHAGGTNWNWGLVEMNNADFNLYHGFIMNCTIPTTGLGANSRLMGLFNGTGWTNPNS